MSDLKMKAWHIENLIEAEPDAQVVLLCEAEELINRLRAENGNQHDLIMRQCDILTNTANALKGEPDSLSLHSHHDLAEVASKLNAERQKLISFVTEISEQFHWDLCIQCEDNIYNAEDIIEEIKESEND